MLMDNELGQVYRFLSNNPRVFTREMCPALFSMSREILHMIQAKWDLLQDPKSHVNYTDSLSLFYQTFC